MTKRRREPSVPAKVEPIYRTIVAATDSFCRKRLNEEYADLCRKMAAALSLKRPSPLERGKPNTWACAIVYAIGRVNFLFDSTQTPHIRADELARCFSVSQSTVSTKSNQILDMLNIGLTDHEWCLPSLMDQNPMVWFIQVDGFVIDARTASREIQEEAVRLGLIPYLP